jgi:hypothetical protein
MNSIQFLAWALAAFGVPLLAAKPAMAAASTTGPVVLRVYTDYV